MKKKAVITASIALAAALCVPTAAFAFGSPQSHAQSQKAVRAAAIQEAAQPIFELVENTVVPEVQTLENTPAPVADVAEAAEAVETPAAEVPATTYGYYFVDNDGDSICDNYGTGGNGYCGGYGNGYCGGAGAGNGYGAANGYCDGTGYGAASGQGGHHGGAHHRW